MNDEQPRPSARTSRADEIAALLVNVGALTDVHLLLEEGLHGGRRLDRTFLTQPSVALTATAQMLATESAERVASEGSAIDLVIWAESESAIVAQELSAALGVPALSGSHVHQPDLIRPRARALIVAGIITADETLHALIPTLYLVGAHPIAVATVLDGSHRRPTFPVEGREPLPLITAATFEGSVAASKHCPRCAAGEPIDQPNRGRD